MSFAAQPQELDGAGCPQAKPEGRGNRGQLFAYFLAAESRSACGPRPALRQKNRHIAPTKTKIKSASSLITSSASSYQNRIVLSPATEAGSRPGRRVTFLARTRKVTQRMRPDCLRPYATFHFAPGKPASRDSICGAAKLALRCARRSNTLPQVSSRSNAVLRQRCPQPEPRAAGADTRAGAGGLQAL